MRYLQVAVRAHTEPETWRPRQRGKPWERPDEEYVLVLDTETRLTPAQALLFGCYRVLWIVWTSAPPLVRCLEEGLFHPASLHKESPQELACLVDYARRHVPAVDTECLRPGSSTPARADLRLLSRSGVVRDLVLPACETREPVVAFNFGWDFSRLAEFSGLARGKFLGGFRLVLLSSPTREGKRRARVWARTKRLAPKRHLLELGAISPYRDMRRPVFARPLDLHTLVFAETGRDHSLDSAARAFDLAVGKLPKPPLGLVTPGLIDYCRRDVEVTAALYVALMAEFRRHPIGLDPVHAMSPATLASSYLDAIGAVRPLRTIC